VTIPDHVHKLAWFLQRSIVACGMQDPTRLRFSANKYGPYSDQLRRVLDGLDGSYLHYEKRLSEAGPEEPICSIDAKCDAVAAYLEGYEAREYLPALDATTRIIDGFESPLGMELLATVDWLQHEEACAPTVPALKAALAACPGGSGAGERKLRLFDERRLALALDRLADSPVAEPARLC
jgi:hypothetical protein